MADRDYYEILGVQKDATQDDIAKAFRALATKYHPDKNPDDPEEASKKFKEITKAYEILGNAEKRAKFDRLGGDEETLDMNGAFGDIFGRFFHQNQRRSTDIKVDVLIDLESVNSGCSRSVSVQRFRKCKDCSGSGALKTESCEACGGAGRKVTLQGPFTLQSICPVCKGKGTRIVEPCPVCNGTCGQKETEEVQVDIPPGIENGMHLKIPHKDGDIYVLVLVREHPLFVRYGSDLVCEIPVTYTQLALGALVDIPTIDSKATLKIPAKSQSGAKLKLKGMGLPRLDMQGKGDLYAIVSLEVPKTLTDEYKAALEALVELEQAQNCPKIQEFKKVYQ